MTTDRAQMDGVSLQVANGVHPTSQLIQRKAHKAIDQQEKPDSEQEHVEVFRRPVRTQHQGSRLQCLLGARQWVLLNYHALPDWAKDNDYITTCYRETPLDWQGVFSSLFYVHNQTGNIYTHYLAGLLFTCLVYHTYTHILLPGDATWLELGVWAVFFACAHWCFLASATFHLVLCNSHKALQVGGRCDYTGIVLMIIGSFYVTMLYGYACHPTHLAVYLTIGTLLSLLATCACFMPKFYTPAWRPVRSAMFSALGLSGALPIIQLVAMKGMSGASRAVAFEYLLASGSSYILGSILFAARVPERWAPGRFDLIGHSHQIHHCTSALGALLHWYSAVQAFKVHHTEGCLADS